MHLIVCYTLSMDRETNNLLISTDGGNTMDTITITKTKFNEYRVFDSIALESFIYPDLETAEVVADSLRSVYNSMLTV